MIKKTLVLGVIAFALVACGKKEEAPAGGGATGAASLTNATAKIGSCNKLANVGKCTEYDLSKDTLGLSKGGCEATDGKWQTNACPTEKQFANCATSETKIFYYSGTTDPGSALTMDDEFAKLDCELMSGKLTVTGKAQAAAPEAKADGKGAPAGNGAAKKPAAAGAATGTGAAKKK